MTATIVRYPDPAALVAAAADVVARELRETVERRGQARVVLAGGETPRALYRRLAEYREGLPWANVWWFFGDERWVPKNDPLSNFAMVEQALFSKAPIPRAQIVAVPTDAANPAAGARTYEAALRAHVPGVDWPEFDLVVMGLGADGHTASLFPGDPALGEGAAWVTTTRAGRPVPDRVTLTVPVFTRARSMLFLVTGAAKADALAATLTGLRDPTRWPAQAVIPASGRCLWLVDHAAAAKLPSSSS